MGSLVLTLVAVLWGAAAAPSEALLPKGAEVVHLWPAESLAAAAKAGGEKMTESPKGDGKINRVADVADPTVAVVKPPKSDGPTAAVIVCPGGGYSILAYDLEGTEIVQWLNSLGVTGVLLKYRVPGQRAEAFQDAQRAVSIVRSRAKEWNIDPKRIGILGFSAGGHLAARACTNYQKRAYKPVDPCDEASCRPDFAVLIYPAYLATSDDAALDAAQLPVTSQTPAAFIAIAAGDRFTSGALHYFAALRKAKVSSELHVFQFGGHGCGLRKTDANMTTWPQHCEQWMRGMKIIP